MRWAAAALHEVGALGKLIDKSPKLQLLALMGRRLWRRNQLGNNAFHSAQSLATLNMKHKNPG
jgi:hypothetical protein